MRHRKHTFKIGRSGAHRKALLANQVSSLIVQGEIKTTLVKAKESRRIAEKMVTMGKKGDLHHRRLAIAKLRDKNAVARLFSEIAPRYANRDGGYTRIIKLGRRVGDAAEMCLLQWVEEEKLAKKSGKSAKKNTPKSEDAKSAVTAPEEEPAKDTGIKDESKEKPEEKPEEEAVKAENGKPAEKREQSDETVDETEEK